MTWPLPALLAWGLAWLLFNALNAFAAPAWLALAVASTAGALLSLWGSTPWRRVFIAGGFPLSLLASGMSDTMPAWAWLLPLMLLILLYPVSTWRDAPLFPTPAGSLLALRPAAQPSRARYRTRSGLERERSSYQWALRRR